MSTPYQLLPPLTAEAYAALRADIAARGVMVPIERDESGAILDGHNRAAIAAELGIDAPSVTRVGMSEAQKREHVLKLNLLRRQLGPIAWADAFRTLAEARGIRLGQGQRNGRTSDTMSEVAAELGVTERTARRRLNLAAALAADPELAGAVDRGELTPAAARDRARRVKIRAIGERIAREPAPLPVGPFRVIVADPPWRYDSRAEDATHRARTPYPTMSIDEIAALPVAALAHAHAVLWLWTTNAHHEHAYGIARAWGFEPRTTLTWVKDRMGVGDWLRGQTEHCLMAVRGRPVVTLTNQTTALVAPLREHSRKPDEFYTLVEALCPGSKVELFAREARPGWQRWGAEAPMEAAS